MSHLDALLVHVRAGDLAALMREPGAVTQLRSNIGRLFYEAAASGQTAIIEWLVASGLTVGDAEADDGAAMRAAIQNGHWAAAHTIFQFVRGGQQRRARYGIMWQAARVGAIGALEWLARRGFTPDDFRADQNRAMREAALAGKLNVIHWLLDKGGISVAEAAQVNVLRMACPSILVGLLDLFVAEGMRNQHLVAAGALGHVAALGRVDVMEKLYARGLVTADLRAHDNAPLYEAARAGHVDMFAWLVHKGLTAADLSCHRISHEVLHAGNMQMLEIMIKAGWRPTAVDLCEAITYGHAEVVKLFIDRRLVGADEVLADDSAALHLCKLFEQNTMMAALMAIVCA